MLVVSATHQLLRRVPPSLTCTSADQTRCRALCSPRQRPLWRASFGMFPLHVIVLPQAFFCHRGADSMPTRSESWWRCSPKGDPTSRSWRSIRR